LVVTTPYRKCRHFSAPLQDIVQLGVCRENEKFGRKYLMRVFDGFGDSESIEIRVPVVVSSRGMHGSVACTVG
jgi:hypothetical protein